MVEAVLGLLSAANLLLTCALAIVAALFSAVVLAVGLCLGVSATAGSFVLARRSAGRKWVLALAALVVALGVGSLGAAVAAVLSLGG